MLVAVFAGPSIFGVDPSELEGLCLYPPAVCGDLLRVAQRSAGAIGLIDGAFESAPAVWHKEILAALSQGVAVFGASSMGALRAAECCDFGMVGIGDIFDAYRTGLRKADADVAVVHAPEALHYRPLTEALVNVEATIARVLDLALISAEEAAALIAAARGIHFKERDWTGIVAATNMPGNRRADVLELVKTCAVNQKRNDARSLLKRMRELAAGHALKIPAFPGAFHRTVFFAALESRVIRARRRAGND